MFTDCDDLDALGIKLINMHERGSQSQTGKSRHNNKDSYYLAKQHHKEEKDYD